MMQGTALVKKTRIHYHVVTNCGYRIAVIISVFQTDDTGSTPVTRSTKTLFFGRVFLFWVASVTQGAVLTFGTFSASIT